MEIVGIDFGTTNVRISTWNSTAQDAGGPQPRLIGRGNTFTMPVVVALQRQSGGTVDMAVGEDADELENGPDTVVISNIKRWALSNDSYVKWRLETSNTEWPTWWNPELNCVEVWGNQFPAEELISAILREAVRRADLPPQFEWRAGCPVHAGYAYRRMLSEILTEFAGQGRVDWVVDEPVLFLAAALNNDPDSVLKSPGSYLVYDLGGGSFDCTLVEIAGQEILASGADGHPLLGGSNIDRALAKKLNYNGALNLLRLAKQQVSPENPTVRINDNLSLHWSDVESVFQEEKFLRLSLMSLRDTFVSSESFASLGESDGDDPGNMVLSSPSQKTGEVRFTWQLTYDDMGRELDGVILYGGPTLSPYFPKNLARWFPPDESGSPKILLTRDLIKGVADPEITAVSIGACYYPQLDYFHEVPSRLPYRIVLENRLTGDDKTRVEYQPHQHFLETYQPSQNFTSPWLTQELDNPQEYELTITDTNGLVLAQQLVDGYLEDGNSHPATGLRLVIDRLGPVCIEKRSEGAGLTWTKKVEVIENPPWQSEKQREAIKLRQARKREREEERRLRLVEALNRPVHLDVN